MTAFAEDVLVVGGGIGGLSAALALARVGRRVHVVEQAERFAEIGAGLQLGPNAVRAFDRFGVLDPVLREAVLPPQAVIRDAVTGEILTQLDFGASFRRRYQYPYVVAHRHDVLSALLAACQAESGITLETGRAVTRVREGVAAAEAFFADGSVIAARLLVGADGIHSRVRRLLDDSLPRFSGHVAYRGTVSRAQVGLASDDVVLWIGPRMHLMQYPVRRGQLYNQVAVYERPAGREEPLGDTAEFLEAFACAHHSVRDSVALIDTARHWPVCDREPVSGWTTPHTALVGDAAHAMLQYLGQGACQALEDALALAAAFAHQPRNQDEALQAYEKRRVAPASRCQRVARPWGALWHTQDPVLLALRNRVFRLRSADDYTDLDWLYAEPGTST